MVLFASKLLSRSSWYTARHSEHKKSDMMRATQAAAGTPGGILLLVQSFVTMSWLLHGEVQLKLLELCWLVRVAYGHRLPPPRRLPAALLRPSQHAHQPLAAAVLERVLQNC